ncbi:SRPBCC domain-containing protein [Microbacterium gilvum]|uniref:Activator of Hsp90 ATPase homologue 1/2-like C-terminal domain-containing protein n=1 Tax=Microbacterium gilvum TaxID=1336204 RepID=A0ABP9A2W8_9MICO
MSIPPLRRQIVVAAPPDDAWRLFVDDIGRWWPLASHGCFGADASLARAGGQLVETSPTGERAVWGTITEERRPERIAFTWHPGRGPEKASAVLVEFTSCGDGTLVTLVHTGWEAHADPVAARAEYAVGWMAVLGHYAEAAGEAAGTGPVWLVLEHTAGPAAPAGGVFASPDFPKHLDFLRALAADRALVAGGPLPDDPGSGMTVVRAMDIAQAARVARAAQVDDGAVRAGLLDVRVRPWRVAMTGA